MRRLLRRLGPAWRVHRRRHPEAAARLEAAVLAARGSLPEEVAALRSRVAELQRDHLLLAAHVATLTEQVSTGARPVASGSDPEALQRARLAAVAFYEERIGRLEEQAAGRGIARDGRRQASDSQISDERPETAR